MKDLIDKAFKYTYDRAKELAAIEDLVQEIESKLDFKLEKVESIFILNAAPTLIFKNSAGKTISFDLFVDYVTDLFGVTGHRGLSFLDETTFDCYEDLRAFILEALKDV